MSILEILHKGEIKFDKFKLKTKQKLNLFDPFIIYPYNGYANKDNVHLMGRVLEKEGILKSGEEAGTVYKQLWHMFKRYESDEIPFADVEVAFKNKKHNCQANEEGFLDEMLPLEEPIDTSKGNWHQLKLTLKDNPYTDQEDVSATADIMVPDDNATFGIVSDVDDTIIQSFATNTYLKFKTLLLKNATGRVPFEGVADFYKALQKGTAGFNPLFFVSGSTWNIYDLLNRFREHHEIPKAPFFLREFGINSNMFIQRDTRKFKKERIKHLFKFYPDLPFIFIGDSGQHDPEIYSSIAREFPDRVKAIYIRKVHETKVSEKRKEIQEEMNDLNIPILFIHSTEKAFNHAKEQGYIG